MKAFNDWFKEKVAQLKQNGVLDSELHYLRASLFAAYESSNDPLFRTYIEQQKDDLRDHPDRKCDWKTLMSRASKKVDSLTLASKRASMTPTATEDPIMALQAEVRQHQKTIDQMAKQLKNQGGKSSGKGGKKKIKFPEELKDKPKPSDPSKPEVHDGINCYWCIHHERWGRHSSSECKLNQEDSQGGSGGKSSSNGSRGTRFVKALAAIVDEEEDK